MHAQRFGAASPSTAVTAPPRHPARSAPNPRSSPYKKKKAVQFAPSVRARDDERKRKRKKKKQKHEAWERDRARSDGPRIKRVACECCRVRPVGWTVDGEGYCDGCYREGREGRCGW